jgi:hypothetical protein
VALSWLKACEDKTKQSARATTAKNDFLTIFGTPPFTSENSISGVSGQQYPHTLRHRKGARPRRTQRATGGAAIALPNEYSGSLWKFFIYNTEWTVRKTKFVKICNYINLWKSGLPKTE